MAALIDDVRTALRARTTSLDGDIQLLIDAAVYDLKRVGIILPENIDDATPEVRMAIISYVKSQFGLSDIDRKDAFWKVYEKLRLSLLLDIDQTTPPGGD